MASINMTTTSAAVYGAHGSDDAVLFYAGAYLAASPDAGCVYEQHIEAVVLDQGVYGVAGGARYVADDGAGFAGERVEQHGLADVRASDDGKAQVGFGFGELGFGREVFDDFGHHIVQADVVVAADGVRVAKPQLVKLDRALRLSLGVRLVDGEDDRLAAGSQYVGDVYVRAGNAFCNISDHYHDVGVFDGRLDLGADLAPHIGIREDFEAAGVN